MWSKLSPLEKFLISITVVIAVIIGSVAIWGFIQNRKSQALEEKIQALEQQVQEKEVEKNQAIGQRDALKAQSDALNPKLDAIRQQASDSDNRLASINSKINQERKTYEDAKNSRANSNAPTADVLANTCAKLKAAGLLAAADPCQ